MLQPRVLLKPLFTVTEQTFCHCSSLTGEGGRQQRHRYRAPNTPEWQTGRAGGAGQRLNHTPKKLTTNRASCFSHVLQSLCVSEIKGAENEYESVRHCRQGRSPVREFSSNTPQKTNDFFIPLGKCCSVQGNHR